MARCIKQLTMWAFTSLEGLLNEMFMNLYCIRLVQHLSQYITIWWYIWSPYSTFLKSFYESFLVRRGNFMHKCTIAKQRYRSLDQCPVRANNCNWMPLLLRCQTILCVYLAITNTTMSLRILNMHCVCVFEPSLYA